MPKHPLKLITSIVLCELSGLLATPFTISAVQTWYRTLNKPFFSPPNWVFSPVWTTLYAMMGIAAYLIWIQGLQKKAVRQALIWFLVQLFLNFFWSLLFFGMRSPELAFIDIILLWMAIIITMAQFYKLSKPAAYLLVPYLLWVTFASALNLAIVLLN